MKFLIRIFALASFSLLFACGKEAPIKEKDVVYGEADGQKLLLDVTSPAEKQTALRPALLLVHGGAWSAGDKDDFKEMEANLIGQGYVLFSINYRLVTASRNKWPAQLEDTEQAVKWIRANAKKYGADPDRIGAIGGSAGGHLVACLATSSANKVNCVVDLSVPTDLTEDFSKKVAEGAWCNEQVRILLGGTPAQVPKQADSASPLFHVDRNATPILIVHGGKDPIVPVDQAERFAKALTAAGAEAELLVFAEEGHGIEGMVNMLQLVTQMHAFLKKHLKP